jgi:hypothetical protein
MFVSSSFNTYVNLPKKKVLWQKKKRIQKERWYQRERNKESIPYSRGDEART